MVVASVHRIMVGGQWLIAAEQLGINGVVEFGLVEVYITTVEDVLGGVEKGGFVHGEFKVNKLICETRTLRELIIK